jgi:Domain of unknown function (DUF1905)
VIRLSFDAEVWLWEGGSWHFVSLPPDDADDIVEQAGGRPGRGFGSVPVDAAIGKTRWSTSIFPDKKRGTYVLPVKKAVREAEGAVAGKTVRVELVVKL